MDPNYINTKLLTLIT